VPSIVRLQPFEAGIDRLFLTEVDNGARSVDTAQRGGLDGQNYRCSIRKLLKWPRTPPHRLQGNANLIFASSASTRARPKEAER
jgi:hypothetical protein